MKRNNYSRDSSQKPASAFGNAAAAGINQDELELAPSPDEIARRAYFSYVNEGSPPGRDVQHWLDAEEQLLTERNRTRVHGFHNRT
jgi:hypothetical protein